MEFGRQQELEILRETGSGLFLGDEEGNDILLPGKYIPDNFKVGDMLLVFVYKDGEGRLIATTMEPKITLHEFELLRVEKVSEYGAFLDMGIEKDLFVPYREQQQKMLEGRYYLIFMYIDEDTDRLVGSNQINRFLDDDEITVKPGEEVDILVWEPTDLGYNVIINDLHKGLVYDNEIFTQLRPGQRRKAYIKNVREDNKIDVILQKPGYQNIVEPNSKKILDYLSSKKGFMPLTDKSNPDEIVFHLEMSKKTFKKAIGLLYKKRLIRLEKDGTYLAEAQDDNIQRN